MSCIVVHELCSCIDVALLLLVVADALTYTTSLGGLLLTSHLRGGTQIAMLARVGGIFPPPGRPTPFSTVLHRYIPYSLTVPDGSCFTLHTNTCLTVTLHLALDMMTLLLMGPLRRRALLPYSNHARNTTTALLCVLSLPSAGVRADDANGLRAQQRHVHVHVVAVLPRPRWQSAARHPRSSPLELRGGEGRRGGVLRPEPRPWPACKLLQVRFWKPIRGPYPRIAKRS